MESRKGQSVYVQNESKTMKALPLSERPYEKAEAYGAESLSDAELLAIILRSGTKNRSARDLAEEILLTGEPPGLRGLLHRALPDYREIHGIGTVKAIQLACIGELSRRIWKESVFLEAPCFTHPQEIAGYYMEELRHKEQENMKLLILNQKNRLVKELDISKGTVNAALITPRELFIEALRFRGVSIILLHNHPSGDAEPSSADRLLTERIGKAGALIGIPLLDHIIIGDNSYVSFREQGILDP